jgi:flagellar hook assembly protein FlgD
MIGNCNPVATTDLEKNISFTVQPNPFSETINFVFEKNNSIENGTIKIYDSLGKEIRIFNFSNKNKVAWNGKNGNGNEVTAGIYFYTFSNKKNIIQSGKIIKM